MAPRSSTSSRSATVSSDRRSVKAPEQHDTDRAEANGLEATRHPLLASLGAAVRTRRTALGLTRQALATEAGLSLRFLAEVESGQANVSVLKLADLAQALHVTLPSLLSGDGSATVTPQHPSVIALVGLRGAGKSTVGPLLAARLSIPFVELDTLIQEGSGLALAELFELHGENFYRRAEREALERVVDSGKPCIVAASGGIVTDPQALGLLRERTLMVWLKTKPEQYIPRLEAQGDQRPMANRPNALAQLQGLLRARIPYYRQARLVLDTGQDTPEACAERLTAEIQRLTAAGS
jgi:XRE family transcriptional regulator, aerobic/anaerobic benzoate catabolism transcriptional regulator